MTTDEMDGMQSGESRTDVWKMCQACGGWTNLFGTFSQLCVHCRTTDRFDARTTISAKTFDVERAKAATAKLKRKIARKR